MIANRGVRKKTTTTLSASVVIVSIMLLSWLNTSPLVRGFTLNSRRYLRFGYGTRSIWLSSPTGGTSSSEDGSSVDDAFAPSSSLLNKTKEDVEMNGSKDPLGDFRLVEGTVDPRTPCGVLSIDPQQVEVATLDTEFEEIITANGDEAPLSEEELRNLPFVNLFRGSANYIANHRGTIAVYHIPGEVVELPENIFRDLMNDIALTWLLGMKIILVAGCRHQVKKRVAQKDRNFGIVTTDPETLRIVKEEAGYVRFEVERQLARSLRLQGGGSGGTSDGNVVSGNFYSAQPFGILNGVDHQYTGFVRRVEVEKIRNVLDSRDICLLTTLGVSPSGEVFNVNSEGLAATVGGAIEASKVIFLTEREVELRHKAHGNKIPHLRMGDARRLLDHFDIQVRNRGYVTKGERFDLDQTAADLISKIGWGTRALELGVKRAHIISPKHGAVLQELYTRDGSGTLVSGDLYEGIRQATVNDVSGVHELILPLIQMGTLVDRPKSVLERDIENYYVYTRDNLIVACGQLKLFDEGYAEIGCLVVNREYRSRGRGDAMLGYLERLSVQSGASTVFVLSTQTMEWFLERGFDEVSVNALPQSRQASYNYGRASKIYLKKIDNVRDLDASELWWNR